MNTLSIQNLYAEINGQEILSGVNLEIRQGEIHAIMGPNGSGKSTLVNVIMGHPKYTVTKGSITLNQKDLLALTPDERAAEGLFLGFQQPKEIPGVLFGNFLRTAKNKQIRTREQGETLSPKAFIPRIKEELSALDLDTTFMGRSINEGFSGGEKKRAEIVQMKILEPNFALLDEIDSGLDIDALKCVAKEILNLKEKTQMGLILITHYQRLLDLIEPDTVHILQDGKIVESGGKALATTLEEQGYKK